MRKIALVLTVIGLCIMGTSAFGEGVDEYTVLMLHFNGEDGSTNIIDDSDSSHNVTVYDNTQLNTAEKKFGSASLLLDGNSDYITVPDSDDWTFGDGDFTVDLWVKFAAKDVDQFICHIGNQSGYENIYARLNNDNKLTMAFYTGAGSACQGSFVMTNAWGLSLNTWYHIAFIRNGNSAYIFIDGVSQTLTITTAFGPIANQTGNLYIGRAAYTAYGYLNGWLDEFRISKGIARWTSNFTPPTSEYDGIPNDLPIANAGDDLTANVGVEVTLDGSMSSDPDGSIVSWVWRSLSDPQKPIIAKGEYAAVKAHGYAEELVELTVTDNRGGSATDTMKIINPSIQGPPGPPGMTPEEIAAIQNQITTLQQENLTLQQQNANQQQRLEEDRYLLQQLPQLQKKIAELKSQAQ